MLQYETQFRFRNNIYLKTISQQAHLFDKQLRLSQNGRGFLCVWLNYYVNVIKPVVYCFDTRVRIKLCYTFLVQLV